jgi:hypothetical protein
MRGMDSLPSAGVKSIAADTATTDAVKRIYSDFLGIEWRPEGEQQYPHLAQVCERIFRHVQRSAKGKEAYQSRVDATNKVAVIFLYEYTHHDIEHQILVELSAEALNARKTDVEQDRIYVLFHCAMAEERLEQGDKVSRGKKKDGEGGGAKTLARHSRKDVEDAINRAREWLKKASPSPQEKHEATVMLEQSKVPIPPVPVAKAAASPPRPVPVASAQNVAEKRRQVAHLLGHPF